MRFLAFPTIIALTASAILAAPGSAQTTPPSDSTAQKAAAPKRLMRWDATLRATLANSAAGGLVERQTTTGSLTLTELGVERMRLQLRLSTSMNDAGSLQWAIYPGGCGGKAMPIMAIERFPLIQVGSGGRGELDLDIALTIPSSGEHHVKVYRGGESFNNILTCGALRARR